MVYALYVHAGYDVYWLVKNISDNVLVLSVVLGRSVATRSLKFTHNQPRWVVNKFPVKKAIVLRLSDTATLK